MSTTIRPMASPDRDAVVSMMEVFYASPAVSTNGSEEIFQADFDACIGTSPYLEGFIFEDSGRIQGYAMLARSFSTEFGKECVWIEDLYIQPSFRGLGIGSAFFGFIESRYPDAIFRLEVEPENECAVHVYRKSGFGTLPYMEMARTSRNR